MTSKGEKDVETIERTAWLKGLCFSGITELIESLEFVSNIIFIDFYCFEYYKEKLYLNSEGKNQPRMAPKQGIQIGARNQIP